MRQGKVIQILYQSIDCHMPDNSCLNWNGKTGHYRSNLKDVTTKVTQETSRNARDSVQNEWNVNMFTPQNFKTKCDINCEVDKVKNSLQNKSMRGCVLS